LLNASDEDADFTFHYAPKLRLRIAGRGADVHALARLARELAEEYNRLRASPAAPAEPERVADAELERAIAALGYERLPGDGWRERVFPRRLRAADDAPEGLRGWEETGQFASCLTAGEDRFGQLLAGWCGEPGRSRRGRASRCRAPEPSPAR
jgi:hypothetical protein